MNRYRNKFTLINKGSDCMTNDDYIQWEPLVKKVAYKYRNNVFNLDIDDLIQIGAMGLMYAFDTYKEDAGASKKSYFYNCIEWRIIREFTNLKRAKRFCLDTVSLDTPLKNDEETFISDIIPDDKVNIEAIALDTVAIKKYIDEINNVLHGLDRDIVMYKLFDDLTNHEIALALDIEDKKVNSAYQLAKKKLKRKSKLIRIEYLKYMQKKFSEYDFYNPLDYVTFKARIEKLENDLKKENKKEG